MGFYIQDCYWEAVEEQPKKVQQEVIWAATVLYFTGEIPELKGTSKSIFAVIRDRVFQARKKAEQKRNERATDDATDDATECATEFPLPLIKSERERESKREKKRFTPPTREEAGEYLASLGLSADLEKIFDHYESNGWKCGRNPMKDWRAAFRRAAREWAKGGDDGGLGEYTRAF